MTLREFSNVLTTLATQLRADVDEVTLRAYHEALKDLELAFIAMAAERFAKTSAWFPKTSEWRAMTARIEAERLDAQRALLRRLPMPLCDQCGDSGWCEDPTPAREQTWLRRTKDHVDVVAIKSSPPRRRCDCQTERRLEVLGLRPWPVQSDRAQVGEAKDKRR